MQYHQLYSIGQVGLSAMILYHNFLLMIFQMVFSIIKTRIILLWIRKYNYRLFTWFLGTLE